MSLLLEPVWNWPWVLITACAMIGIVLATYPARVRHLPPAWRRSLLGLRLAAVLTLIFAMLRPAVQYTEEDAERSEILFLLDGSRSMNTSDGPGGVSRREWLVKTLADIQPVLDELAQDVDVRFIDFSSTLVPVVTPDEKAEGTTTAIGKVIDDLREQEQGDRMIGIFLLSDGAQRAGGDEDIDPSAAARRFAEQQSVPIHTVVFGTSELAGSGLDLAIENLSLDQPVTFERKTVPVRMQVRLLGAAGKKVRVRLLIEDRTGKSPGESGPLKEIPIVGESRPFREIQTRENSATVPVELTFIAERSGEYKIAAEVVPEEGEVRVNNNRLETLISVRKGGLRVAYFDIPRPEQAFLRKLNETARIQLDTQVILPGRLAGRTELDPALFQPGAYDVYLIGDVPASVFQGKSGNHLDQLAKRVAEGAGLGMLGGLHSHGPGGYASTVLADLLPTRMSVSERVSPDTISTDRQITREIRMLPTQTRSNHYLMRLSGGSDSRQIWNALPKLGGANQLTPKSGAADVLAESEAGDPLLIVGESGGGRVLSLGVDETWKWHLHGYAAEHQRFWQQLVMWLARKEFESDSNVWVRVEPRNFPPLAKIPIEFGVKDDHGNPVAGANFKVEITKPDGTTTPATPQVFGDGGIAPFSDTSLPGDYWVRVTATSQGSALGLSELTRFVVDSRDIELDNPAADPGLMAELAAMTGGSAVPPEDLGAFLKALFEQGIPAELKRLRRVNLWDGWPMLLVFVGLMSLEWLLRKLRGMV